MSGARSLNLAPSEAITVAARFRRVEAAADELAQVIAAASESIQAGDSVGMLHALRVAEAIVAKKYLPPIA